jgi:hypothetical protein
MEPKVSSRVLKSPPLFSILSQKIQFYSILPLTPKLFISHCYIAMWFFIPLMSLRHMRNY